MDFNKLLDDAFEQMESYELTDEEIELLNSLKNKKPDMNNLMKGNFEDNIKDLQNFQKELENYAHKINGKK